VAWHILRKGFRKNRYNILQNVYWFSLLCLIIPLLLAQSLGLLRPLEAANYDLLFYLNPTETIDQRIVLVEWDEESIQTLQESTISDRTLVRVLQKILEQKPRVIGIDLYRDIPVYSPRLNIEENIQANKSLNRVFLSHSNIFGIQKTRQPVVAPPKSLQSKQRVAASDIHPDSDYRIRQVYLFPNTDKYNKPTQIPYIGIVLGYQYLTYDGWQASNIAEGIKIYNQNQQIILKPLSRGLGSIWQHDYGWKFFLNWRKTKFDSAFPTVSVAAIIQNRLESNFFNNKLVIIGNATSYSGDWHSTSLNRWLDKKLVNGLNIVAQTASSIITAASEQRNLINPIPYWLECLLAIIPIVGITTIANNIAHNPSFSVSKLKLITGWYSIVFISLLACLSFFGFRWGCWINVTPGILGVSFCWIIINNYYQSKKELEHFDNLAIAIEDLNHVLGNVSGHLGLSTREITRGCRKIIQQVENDLKDNGIFDVTVSETSFNPSLKQISSCVYNINYEASRISRYRKRASAFLNFANFNQDSIAKIGNLNQIVKQTVKNLAQYNYSYQIDIQEQYDSSIGDSKLYTEYLEILVESLLDNAFDAVNPKNNSDREYFPQIKIATINSLGLFKIIITDNGLGIGKKYQSQIFLKKVSFKKVSFKNDGQRGIGLYLVSQIVNYWQGSIFLKSEVGQGSTFTISLPKLE
jgi:adenylate cyclase